MSTSIRASRAFGFLVCLAGIPQVAAFAQDQLLVNGRIFTSNPQQPYAEAVSVHDGSIFSAGSRAEAAASVGSDAVVTDLGGRKGSSMRTGSAV